MNDDLIPVIPEKRSLVVIDQELTKDYEFAKSNMQDLIYKGNDVLKDLIDIATSSQQARAFEVTTALIKTLADANKQMMEASLLNQQIIEKKRINSGTKSESSVTNNNLIVTTAELAKLISGGKLE